MTAFFIGIFILIGGYFVYGSIVERVFVPNPNRETPATKNYDGVDYVPLSKPRNALIELLNIAGTGPIFGPILGVLFGPVVFIIIPIGNIIAGAVHDYFFGMISLRNKGAHIPQLAGYFLGKPMRHVVNLFSLLLLLLLGTVFVRSPADLFVNTLGGNQIYWGIGIYVYYVLATLLPIDKLIGRIYPFLGALLIISAVGIFVGILVKYPHSFTPFTFENIHPKGFPIFPMLFMTITCGLLSGFHATQSPIISRTLQNESQGRLVFYGMMVVEGFIAMVWAAAGMVVYNHAGIFDTAHFGGPAGVVTTISTDIFGKVIGVIAVLGVIVLPITSGDTSFRSLRMIIADYLGIKQKPFVNRLLIAVPLFIISFYLFFVDFDVLWRYFSWANQTTGTISLFVSSGYLYLKRKNYWITFIPAIFMLMATTSYLGNAKIGFGLEWRDAYIFGSVITVILVALFIWRNNRFRKQGEKNGGVPVEDVF